MWRAHLVNIVTEDLPMSSSKPLRLLTISEAAEYLAISERSIKRLIARGDLPCIRVGSALRSRDALTSVFCPHSSVTKQEKVLVYLLVYQVS